jgi:hypothetical protein
VKRMLFGSMIAMLFLAKSVGACSIAFTPSGQEIVKKSDLILHAVALDYVKLPKYYPRKDSYFTTGPADSTVRFQVVEVVKGKYEAKEIVLQGFLGNLAGC